MSWRRAIVCWFGLAVLMVVNGVGRQAVLEPVFGPLRAHQASSLYGVLLIVVAAWLFVPWIGARRSSEQIALGLFWLACTVAFEFAFGHWVVGHSWSALLADYDLAAGRLWPIVLLATTLSPWLVGRLRDRRAA